MIFNLSLLKDIDFSNKDTLFFSAIFLFILIVVILIIVSIIIEIIKTIRSLIIKLFYPRTEWQENQKQKIVVNLPFLKEAETVELPKPKLSASFFAGLFGFGNKETTELSRDASEIYNEKEKLNIEEGLSKLKTNKNSVESSLKSGGFSGFKTDNGTSGNFDKDKESFSKIKIPSKSENNNKEAAVQELGRIKDNKIAEPPASDKIKARSSIGFGAVYNSFQKDNQPSIAGKGAKKEEKGIEFKDIRAGKDKNQTKEKQHLFLKEKKDNSIFDGKNTVSRRELKYEMRKNPDIWKAARQSKITLRPIERAKLVKEVFSNKLGRDISKTDLKWSIKKLRRKMVSSKTPEEHAKFRKEIKFFKKIGGIKK